MDSGKVENHSVSLIEDIGNSVTLVEDNSGVLIDTLGYVTTTPSDYILIETYYLNNVRYNLYRPKNVSLSRNSQDTIIGKYLRLFNFRKSREALTQPHRK